MSTFRDALTDRVLLFDGGMGTQVQAAGLGLHDYRGLENCTEILNLSRPDVIGDIHRRYFDAGADVVETNSFGGAPWVLAEFGLAADVHAINVAAARVAREAADAFSTEARPRFVAGSIGPGTRLPTLGHIRWEEMHAGYQAQVRALLEARRALTVSWPGGGRDFAAGARIHTESSYKYRLDNFTRLLGEAGFGGVTAWTDERCWFAVFLAGVTGAADCAASHP